MIYKPFEIVVVPFPFTDSSTTKRRPAVVLSSETFNKKVSHSILAMVTSSRNTPWPHDISIKNLSQAGLPKPSIIRMKLFTIDHRLIIKSTGSLSKSDQETLKKSFDKVFYRIK